MSDTTARVLDLLGLLQTKRSWSGEELLGRLGVSERTLRRDIERLRDLGYSVVARRGRHGGYRLEAGVEIPPLLLDEEETAAIAIGLLTAAGGTIRGIEETSLRALAKLEQVLPTRVRRRVTVWHTAVTAQARPWIKVDGDTLAVLAQACRDNERVRFAYRTREGATRERHVEPHRVLALYHRWYLLGFDSDRAGWRTFRLDRMSTPRTTGRIFRPRPIPGGDAVAYVENSLPARYEALVTLDAPAAYVSRRMPPGDATVEPIDHDHSLLRLRGDSLDWMAISILWFGVGFRVDEPEELVDHLRATSHRLIAALPAAR